MELTPEQQVVAQRVFLQLVQPTIEGGVRRRRIPRDRLVQLTGDDPMLISTVLKCFEDAELVRRSKGFEGDDDRFEVVHETLVNNWKRLDDWLKVERQSLKRSHNSMQRRNFRQDLAEIPTTCL